VPRGPARDRLGRDVQLGRYVARVKWVSNWRPAHLSLLEHLARGLWQSFALCRRAF
jgi:hypothetical protein